MGSHRSKHDYKRLSPLPSSTNNLSSQQKSKQQRVTNNVQGKIVQVQKAREDTTEFPVTEQVCLVPPHAKSRNFDTIQPERASYSKKSGKSDQDDILESLKNCHSNMANMANISVRTAVSPRASPLVEFDTHVLRKELAIGPGAAVIADYYFVDLSTTPKRKVEDGSPGITPSSNVS